AWHNGDVTLHFGGSDAGSGVAATQYSSDGGVTWTTGTTLTVGAPAGGSNDGIHTVLYRSRDTLGHVEDPAKSCTVKIDTTAETSSVSGADSAWHEGDVNLAFTATGGATVEYSTDGGATWTRGTSLTVSAPADGRDDGAHTVLYRSVDAAGNVESPARSCTVRIDAGAPTTTVTGADAAWHDTDVTLHFSGGDAGSGVAATEYSTDGGATWTSGTTLAIPATADGSNDGTHPVLYRSTDALGHVESPARSCSVKIDTAAPVTTATGADSTWHDSDVTVSFAATDAGSGVDHVEYSTDDGTTWTTGTSVVVPATPDGSNDGVHAIAFRAVDTLGHVEQAQGVAVRIDTDQPITVDNAAGAWHAVPFTLTLTASDRSGTTTQYSIGDDQHWQPGTAAVFATSWRRGGGSGPVTVYYRSTDGAGHVESLKSCVVMLDTSRPTTTDDAPATSRATAVTVHFTVRDTWSGPGETWFQVDQGPWQTGTSVLVPAPADRSNNGLHTIRYFSLDKAGNAQVGYRVCKVTIAAP
ncbi:MAG TPA: hypothetical protein VK576_07660, partial [Thermoleophilia bacterium]|nr:hypothetical protein [Thermoleophilia bacterium]